MLEQCDGSHILDQLSTLEDRAIVLEIALNSDHVDWSDKKIRSALVQQAMDVVNNIREIISKEEQRAA